MSKRPSKQSSRTSRTHTKKPKKDLRRRHGLPITYMEGVVLAGTKLPNWNYYVIY